VDIAIEDIFGRYTNEVAKLTQRAVLAEARADAFEKRVAELEAGTAEEDA